MFSRCSRRKGDQAAASFVTAVSVRNRYRFAPTLLISGRSDSVIIMLTSAGLAGRNGVSIDTATASWLDGSRITSSRLGGAQIDLPPSIMAAM
jgi:hypothetical protein